MRQLTMVCVLALLLGAASQTQADMMVVDIVDTTNGQAGTHFGVGRFYSQDWCWTHTFSPPGPPPAAINWATLEIDAYDIDPASPPLFPNPEFDLISAGGIELGPLVGSANTWSKTTFTLPGLVLNELLDGAVQICVDIDSMNNVNYNVWSAHLGSSTLTVNYEPVPAPGALILGSVGLGLAGWRFRKRSPA